MRVLICGAGGTGRHVAGILAEVHDVTVIDRDAERRLNEHPNLRFVRGDAADPGVLMGAGARDADALIAVTRDDPTNLTIALLAKRRLGVRATVARVNDPAHRWLFTPEAGVDVAVSTAEFVARLVQEEVTAGDLVTLLRLRQPDSGHRDHPAGRRRRGGQVCIAAAPPRGRGPHRDHPRCRRPASRPRGAAAGRRRRRRAVRARPRAPAP